MIPELRPGVESKAFVPKRNTKRCCASATSSLRGDLERDGRKARQNNCCWNVDGPVLGPRVTVWATVLRVTRRRSTRVHSTDTLPPEGSSITLRAADRRGDDRRREGAVTRDEDGFATASSIGSAVGRRKNIRALVLDGPDVAVCCYSGE